LLIRTTRKARRRSVPAFAKNQTKRRKNYRKSEKPHKLVDKLVHVLLRPIILTHQMFICNVLLKLLFEDLEFYLEAFNLSQT
jgi:hypothetical protein